MQMEKIMLDADRLRVIFRVNGVCSARSVADLLAARRQDDDLWAALV